MPGRKSDTEAKPKPQTKSWSDEHTLALVRLIIASALAARPHMYADPALADVNGNGGNRINQKLRALLTTMAKQHAGAENFVNDETERIQAARSSGKRQPTSDDVKPRKRIKRKVESEDDGSADA